MTRTLLALAFMLIILPTVGQAGLPDHLQKAHYDWVLVAPDDLLPAYTPLAAHRLSQGLASLVVGLDEVNRWSPHPENSPETLRWLAQTAHSQWGAGYLVLGGSHTALPAPMHELVFPNGEFISPTDAYFRCLEGDWDVDGDGLVAEFEDDAADPAVHLAVGRLPADDLESATNIVQKIITFENRPAHQTDGALFVASLMDVDWHPELGYPNGFLGIALAQRNLAAALRPSLRIGTLFEDDVVGDPWDDPLNPISLTDSLAARPHDLVYFQLNGSGTAWELSQGLTITHNSLEGVAGCGHAFIGVMLSGDVADTRHESAMMTQLMALDGGGPVAMLAPSGTGYMGPHTIILQALWTYLLEEPPARLGDAFSMAMTAYLESNPNINSYTASTYWYWCLLGDPAMLMRPAESVAQTTPEILALDLQAAPNPFNPRTALRFEVPESGQGDAEVLLEIFDVHGRRVDTLIEGRLAAGPREVSWGGARAAGLYLARLRVDGHESTIKLTLVD